MPDLESRGVCVGAAAEGGGGEGGGGEGGGGEGEGGAARRRGGGAELEGGAEAEQLQRRPEPDPTPGRNQHGRQGEPVSRMRPQMRAGRRHCAGHSEQRVSTRGYECSEDSGMRRNAAECVSSRALVGIQESVLRS